MSDFRLDELITPVPAATWEASIYDVLTLVGTDHSSWGPGSVVRTLIKGVSVCLSGLSSLISAVARSGFAAYAVGTWLDLHGEGTYGVKRTQATYATGVVTLVNTAGGVFALGVGDLVLQNVTTGKTYRNTAVINLGALQTLTGVPIAAVEPGAASTAGPGEISRFVTPLTGVTSTNPLSVVGLDAQSDDEYRKTQQEAGAALSPNGPRDVYAHIAKSAKRLDGSAISVTRVQTKPGTNGALSVYVATASGAVSGSTGNPATDLGAVHDALHKYAAPLTITPTAISAVNVPINVTYEIWLADSGLTVVEVLDTIEAAIRDFVAVQPIGGVLIPPETTGKFYRSTLSAVIGNAIPNIYQVALVDPAADIDLAPGSVAVVGSVDSVDIHFVEV